MNNLRVVYFGNFNLLSENFLVNLIQAQVNITGVLLPGYGSLEIPNNAIPLENNNDESIVNIIRAAEIPVCHRAGDGWSEDIQQFLHSCEPDIILSVCFPHFIPALIRKIARRESLNFHSSLLPKYRGPAPVFWQLYHGETNTGFSIHRLSDDIDAGEILCQQLVSWPSGATAYEIDTLLAVAGVQQFCTLLQDIVHNTAISQTQDATVATYQASPRENDLIIPTTWSAKRAFDLLRGIACHPALIIRATYCDIPVERAVACNPDKFESPAQSGEIDVQFNPGKLRIRKR